MGSVHPSFSATRPSCSVSQSYSFAWESVGISEVPAATVFDVYEIDGLLGSGVFGQVRLCLPRNESDKNKYAVKIVDTQGEVFKSAPGHISARQEASTLRLVKHPHVVELIDVFEQERWLFLVMECITGGDLFAAIADSRTIVTQSRIATVGSQLLQALNHLHERSVVHRDVKAENILLSYHPAKTSRWHVKLIDFGLAIRVAQPHCLFNMTCKEEGPLEECICGTAYYCAPEVWINDYGPKVDVWAAGVVLYLALFGRFPFYHGEINQLEAMICRATLAPTYAPAKANDTQNYQVCPPALRCLEALLTKDHHERLTAEQALKQTWFHSGGTQVASSGAHSPNPGDLLIPLSVRAKAGRAAMRPPMDTLKEQARTAGLEALKARADYASAMSRRTKSTSRGSEESSSTASCSRRDIDPSDPSSVIAILAWEPQDLAPADTSLSDSEVEDEGAMCACTRGGVRQTLARRGLRL
eukprot:TRINITY_DN19495_c0_g1_i1.p1 TRINITY_DN19495_c0_g1~~TRINITY_DN19495_c0_g1_i1.p1  ORF type:complete len:490 (+),score=70.62 TRINITY_DN19495_c0_g1_i1:56-1471(+)